MSDIILTTKQELANTIKSVLLEYDNEKASKQPEKVLTINQVSKLLGKAHATIKKLVGNGTIRSTRDGLIPESAINDYLGQ
jgi:excisionase family DNA binding protein